MKTKIKTNAFRIINNIEKNNKLMLTINNLSNKFKYS